MTSDDYDYEQGTTIAHQNEEEKRTTRKKKKRTQNDSQSVSRR